MSDKVSQTQDYKVQLIHGVPFWMKQADIFLYSSNPPIRLGTVQDLDTNWQTLSAEWLKIYREKLAKETAVALEKAAELQKTKCLS